MEEKVVVRPIIDWSDDDIWEYIEKYKLLYCELYDKGWKRLGCIGCPLSSNQKKELETYPKYRKNYVKAFEKMIEARKAKGKNCEWETGEEVMKWWVGDCIKKNKECEGQCSMF